MTSKLIEIRRAGAVQGIFEIKDPSIVELPDKSYMMYATFFGKDGIPRENAITRFHADRLGGPWQELGPVRVHGVEGPEVCAPQIVLGEENGKPLWTMYVQNACFREGGIIAVATSYDGTDFYSLAKPVMTKDSIAKKDQPVVGLYDVSVSSVTIKGKPYECMLFSGYRTLKSGDLYMALRKQGAKKWGAPRLILKQEDVPFHNRPYSAAFEWGLEGAKITQLSENHYLLTGVCFLEKGLDQRGTRQRVFFAGARSLTERFTAISTPIEPVAGENGHPDVLDLGLRIGIVYQERAGDGKPWHLRYIEYSKAELKQMIDRALAPPAAPHP